MSLGFGKRLTLHSTVGIALVLVVGSLATYLVVRDQLRDQVDSTLREQADRVELIDVPAGSSGSREPFSKPLPNGLSANARTQVLVPQPAFGAAPVHVAVLGPHGEPLSSSPNGVTLPTSERALAAARGGDEVLEDGQARGTHLRVLTRAVDDNRVLVVAYSLAEVDRTLSRLAWSLGLVCFFGTVLAGGVGAAVAHAALKPVRRLTDTAARISHTRDLGERIKIETDDELGRLGTTFNDMLDSLSRSLRTQRQLVSDASHELRTPLTSLRTNIDLLRQGVPLNDSDRARLLHDISAELGELTTLVTNTVELARGGQRELHLTPVRLDDVTGLVVRRAQARFSTLCFRFQAAETTVWADAEELERAIGNLIENAAKWSESGGIVEVSVAGGSVTVRDHGPGVEAADRPFVFERFYRSEEARAQPGSGLGLAIVRQVAESHGGRVQVDDAPGGGARFRLDLVEAV